MALFMNIGYIKANWEKFRNIDTITGSSGGAVIGLFLAMGWHPERIMDALLSINPDVCAKKSIRNLLLRFGYMKTENLKRALLKVCESNPTFSELKKTLYVTSYCVSTHKTVYFSNLTHPDMSVIDAILGSVAIPFLLEPLRYQGDLYVDGGTAELWPLSAPIGWKAEECLLIRTSFKRTDFHEIKNMWEYCKVFISTIFRSMRTQVEIPCKFVILEAEKYDVMDFNMSYETKLQMIMDGATIF
jgi:predicted acylesterase/phospholipase RssA